MSFNKKDELAILGRDSPELNNSQEIEETNSENQTNNIFNVEFDKVESGASDVIPVSPCLIKKGTHVVLEDRPCKIVEIYTIKTGKHGHTKANMTGIDIFNGKKYEKCVPSSLTQYSPIVLREEYMFMNIDDEEYLSLVSKNGQIRSDLKLPHNGEEDELTCLKFKELLEEGKTIIMTVLSSMGIEKISDVKESN